LLESGCCRPQSNGSPCSADDSSRRAEMKVEFVNHPKAVSIRPARGGAIRASAGAGELLLGTGLRRRVCARRVDCGAESDDASVGRNDGPVS
jgi:hypothetical protein